ncbi:hypothetical protein E7X58_33380 [Streptomyces sp. A1499]|nr:hypothetical protein E7X58_33380 [Streptomyces sp. A1499]
MRAGAGRSSGTGAWCGPALREVARIGSVRRLGGRAGLSGPVRGRGRGAVRSGGREAGRRGRLCTGGARTGSPA